MSKPEVLNVWFNQKLVGMLWESSVGKIGFRYDSLWMREGFAISQQLPLDKEEDLPESGKAHRFFANLLPEADARMHIVKDLKISNSDFELLKAIGGECAGALSILSDRDELRVQSHYKKLTDEELRKILLRKGQVFDLTALKDRPRLSLAGAQDKCPIYFDGKNYFLPKDAAPSTHILKFEVAGYRNIPVYEYFLTRLASHVGLPVVDIELRQQDRDHYLLIKRYDRISTDIKYVQRLHQEDFCQALGFGHERKYQEGGGPSFQDCYELLQRVTTTPLQEQEYLLQWQIFNVLAGNSDGHAKNLALLYDENLQIHLAPFYDLVCTRAVERIDTKLAFSVGGEFNPDKISKRHWEKFASDCQVRERYLYTMIQELAEALLQNLLVTQEEFAMNYGAYPALQRVQKVVTKQCQRILKLLA